jgi:hypothetical protein
MLKFRSLRIDDEHSRFGRVKIVVEGSMLRAYQNGEVILEQKTAFPHLDINTFAENFYHKDKIRFYCNKTLMAMVPPRRKYFAMNESIICFHNNREMHIDGSVIRSARTMELSFNRGNHVKKQQMSRVFLELWTERHDEETDAMIFKKTGATKVWWVDRNKHYAEPTITLS